VKIAGRKSATDAVAANALTRIRPRRTPRRNRRSPSAPPGEHADDSADPDDEQHERARGLVDPVLARDELDAEGLDAREEEVAARARQDQKDVGPDSEHVTRRLEQVHPPWVSDVLEDGIGLDAALACQALRVGGLVDVVVGRLGAGGVRAWGD
jgi:hypothetical protein